MVTVLGLQIGQEDITSVTLNGIAATITSQTADNVTVTAAPGISAGSGPVVLESTSIGTVTSWPHNYTYNPTPHILSLSQYSGPLVGGTQLTIIGTSMENNNDATVTVAGYPATTLSQSSTQIVVVTSAAAAPTKGVVIVNSTSAGIATSTATFTYNPTGQVTEVNPQVGAIGGQYQVTISGQNLGADVTAVTLADVAATVLSCDPNGQQVVVSAGSTTAPTTGSVAVYSPTFGKSVGQSFRYRYRM